MKPTHSASQILASYIESIRRRRHEIAIAHSVTPSIPSFSLSLSPSSLYTLWNIRTLIKSKRLMSNMCKAFRLDFTYSFHFIKWFQYFVKGLVVAALISIKFGCLSKKKAMKNGWINWNITLKKNLFLFFDSCFLLFFFNSSKIYSQFS